MKEKDKIPTFYKILKIWANIYHEKLFYRKTYYLNTENIPPAGTPLIIVCNHQNSLNDAMGIVISLDLRYPHFLARADIFKRPFIAKVLRFFGLLPVYRQHDGMANVKINLANFENVVNYIKRGNTLAMYPEAGHQDKHYLGKFFLSYTRLAFDTAVSSNFEKEVFILPCANHYTDYFGWREEMMMTYGKPLSIKPYYESYKTQPREVQEKVNEIIRAEIESMMLNITDLENYDAIYFLLQTYGKKFAVKNNLNPNKLPQKLTADQKLVALLQTASDNNAAKTNELYALAMQYKNELKELKLNDDILNKPLNISSLFVWPILFILGFPLFLYGFLHHIIQYIIPNIIIKKAVTDIMMHGSIKLGVSYATIPLFYLIFFVISLFFMHPLLSIAYLFTLPFFGILAWNYRKSFLHFRKRYRFYRLVISKNKKLENILSIREKLYDTANKIIE